MTEVESFEILVGTDAFTAVATCFFRDGTSFPLYIGRHTLSAWASDFNRERIRQAILDRQDRLIALAVAARSAGKKKLRV